MGSQKPHAWATQPVLAVCGWKNSGKTTLLEQAVRHLRARSLRVGVVKHDAHGIEVDKAGSDSDRLFRAGADIVLQGPEESIERSRQAPRAPLELAVDNLLLTHDIVLVEGHKQTPLPKVWLTSPDKPAPPEGLVNALEAYPWGEDRAPRFLAYLDRWLDSLWRRRPLLGGVLIGGRSSRMGGYPKHLLRFGERSLLEIAVRALEPHVEQVVLLGSGELPDAFASHARLPDVRGVQGPVAGILAALRWEPGAAWCISACDLPLATPEAMRWVVDQRRPGVWAVLPRRSSRAVEPLFATYEPQARPLLEALARAESFSIQQIQAEETVACPSPPEHILPAWTGVNTREELDRLSRSA